MSKKILALILAVMLCLPMIVSCNINLSVPTDDEGDETGLDEKVDGVVGENGEIVSGDKENGGDSNDDNGDTVVDEDGNDDADVDELALAEMVYSFYDDTYGFIGAKRADGGKLLSLALYSYNMELITEASMCSFVYKSGKLAEVKFARNSEIIYRLMDTYKEFNFKISSYDDSGKALSADAIDGVTLEFSYDDEDKSQTMLLAKKDMGTRYAITLDQYGRCTAVVIGNTSRTVSYDGNVCILDGDTAGTEGPLTITYEKNNRIKKVETSDGTETASVEYTLNDKGLCTKAVLSDGMSDAIAVYGYDGDGNLVSMIFSVYDEDTQKEIKYSDIALEYDNDGRLVGFAYTSYDDQGYFGRRETVAYEYSESGSLIKESHASYSENENDKDHESVAEYAADGKRTLTEYAYKNGKVIRKSTTVFDAQGTVVSSDYKEYDENGKEIETTEKNETTEKLPENNGAVENYPGVNGDVTDKDDNGSTNGNKNDSFDTGASPDPDLNNGMNNGSMNGGASAVHPDFGGNMGTTDSNNSSAGTGEELATEAQKQRLHELFEEVYFKHPDDYTTVSYIRLESAIMHTQDIVRDENPTKREVVNAIAKLENALAQLEPKAMATGDVNKATTAAWD